MDDVGKHVNFGIVPVDEFAVEPDFKLRRFHVGLLVLTSNFELRTSNL
jgi:hypothetical protein